MEKREMSNKIRRLRGANLDIDLTTPAGEIAWAQEPCPWNVAEGTDAHRCAVKNTAICPHFCGIEYLDTVLCSYPHPTPTQGSRQSAAELFEVSRDGYVISTDPSRLDITAIHEFLSQRSYWAQDRPLAAVERSIANSLCFGVYEGSKQAGFARVVTDYALFAWLCDVFILEAHRGHGLGKWLIETVTSHPALADLRLAVLATRDAHELYRRYGGFEALPSPESWMLRRRGA